MSARLEQVRPSRIDRPGGECPCSVSPRSAELGTRLLGRLRDGLADKPTVGEVRGLGLFGGIEIVTDRESRSADAARTAAIHRAAFDRGVILGVGGSYENVIKLCPPLTIEAPLLDAALDLTIGTIRGTR